MAEALAIVGLVSAIVQFISFSTEVIGRLNDFCAKSKDVPPAFRDISVRLPLLRSNLKRTKEEAEAKKLDVDVQNSVLAVVESCQAHVQAPDDILLKTLPQLNDSLWKRRKKAILSVYQDKNVRTIAEKLQDNVICLTHHVVVETVQRLTTTPHLQVHPLSMVPFARDSETFVGREKLITAIEEGFLQHQRLALVGLGGIGKSRIAIEYSYRLRDSDPSTWVFWVHAGTSARFKQSFLKIARKLQLPKIEYPDCDIFQDVTDWLCDESNGRWLLVLDSCDDLEVLYIDQTDTLNTPTSNVSKRSSLMRYIPQTAYGTILVTSRNKKVAYNFTNNEHRLIQIGPMNNNEAIELFRSKLPKDPASDKIVSELAEELGFFPLPIEQAAAYISVGSANITISKYLEYIRKNEAYQLSFLLKDFNDITRDYDLQNSIILTWQISFDQIRKHNPAAADLLALMSCFDRESIPKLLLRGEDDDELAFEEAITPLLNFSLVTEIGDSNFTMHRLVQLTTQQWLEARDVRDTWVNRALHILSEKFPGDGVKSRVICETLHPHAEVLIRHSFTPDPIREKLADLLYKLSRYYQILAQFRVAQKTVSEAYSIWQDLLGDEHPTTLNCLHRWGEFLSANESLDEAVSTQRKVLRLRQKVLGKDDIQTLESTVSLAWILACQGKYEEGEKSLREALKSLEAVHTLEARETLICMNYLSHVLRGQGNLDEAADMMQKALDVCERIHGSDHFQTVFSVYNLGLTLNKLRRYEEAQKLFQRTMKLAPRVLGPQHPTTLNMIGSLAPNLKLRGTVHRAAETSQDTVDVQENNLNEENVYVLDNLILEVACPNDGPTSDKATVLRKVSEVQEKVFGLNHPHTISSLHYLALCLQREGKLEEAEVFITKAFEASKVQTGSTELQTLGLATVLASIRRGLKRYDEATAIYRMVLDRRKELLGAKHPDTLASLHDLAYVLYQFHYTDTESSLEEAERLLRKALDGRIEVLSWQNSDTLFSAQVLVQILASQGKLAEAEPLSRETYEGRLRLRGPDDTIVKDTARFLMTILRRQGKTEEAEELQQRLEYNDDVAAT